MQPERLSLGLSGPTKTSGLESTLLQGLVEPRTWGFKRNAGEVCCDLQLCIPSHTEATQVPGTKSSKYHAPGPSTDSNGFRGQHSSLPEVPARI